MMPSPVQDAAFDELVDRLDEAALAGDAQDAMLAATQGPDALEAHLAGDGSAPAAQATGAPLATAPPKAFLEQIAVENFRGIGERARLPLVAGPGLTIVSGRNGSGKSSFAEGLELLLTGDN